MLTGSNVNSCNCTIWNTSIECKSNLLVYKRKTPFACKLFYFPFVLCYGNPYFEGTQKYVCIHIIMHLMMLWRHQMTDKQTIRDNEVFKCLCCDRLLCWLFRIQNPRLFVFRNYFTHLWERNVVCHVRKVRVSVWCCVY